MATWESPRQKDKKRTGLTDDAVLAEIQRLIGPDREVTLAHDPVNDKILELDIPSADEAELQRVITALTAKWPTAMV